MDLAGNAAAGSVTAEAVRNSWWYAHRARSSKAAAVYADIYRLPQDIGRFDVSTFGSILLHLENPFKALHEAARVTDRALVVTDLLPDVIYGDEHNSFLGFNPGDEPENLVNWWRLSPNAVTKMFRVLGFPHADIHYFENTYHPYHQTELDPVTRFMFAAVGQREPGAIPRREKTSEEIAMDQRLRERIPAIHVHNYNEG